MELPSLCSLVMGSSGLESALQMFLTSTEQKGRAPLLTSWRGQVAVSLLCCEGTLLAHGQLVYQDPQVLLGEAASQWFGPQPIPVPGVPPKVQDFALPFCCISCLLLFSQPVKIPLNSSTTLWYINYFSFCVVCELAEGTLCLTLQVIDGGVEQYWLSYWHLGCVFDDWPTAGLGASDPQCFELITVDSFHCWSLLILDGKLD